MKKIILLLTTVAACATLTNLAFAACPGAYLGLGAGYGIAKTPNQFAFDVSGGGTTTRDRGGVSGRVFAGVNIVNYLGLEAGYTAYAYSNYNASTVFGSSLLQYKFYTYDVVAKAYLPISRTGFEVYGIAGAARVAAIVRYPNNTVFLSGPIATPLIVGGNTHAYKTRPIYGLGLTYSFTPCLTAHVEATQVRRLGNFQNSATAIPYLNLATINLAYHYN